MERTMEPKTCEMEPKTCEICFEKKMTLKPNIYKKKIKCSNSHSFCQECVATHIFHKIEAKHAHISCPGVDCKAVIEPLQCRSLITSSSFVKWCDNLVDSWIAGKGHRRAVCPHEGCSEVAIDECKGGGRQECPRCKRVFCFGCGVKWERNHHERCRFEEVVFLNAARQGNWKRCPNCRLFIQKRAGCNKVTCRCRTTFCYKCGVRRCRCWLSAFIFQLCVPICALVIISVLFFRYYR